MGAAELVDGAGAGALLGGAGADLDDAGVALLLAVGWAAAWGAGWAPEPALALAAARGRLWRALPDGEADGAETVGDACAAGAVAESLTVVWAGAVRANRAAKPTAVTALSWVARQVRRDRRRSPAERAAPGCSAGNSAVSPEGKSAGDSGPYRMTGDHSRVTVKSS